MSRRALVALVATALLATACSGDDGDEAAPTDRADTTTTVALAEPTPADPLGDLEPLGEPDDVLTQTVRVAEDRQPAEVGSITLPHRRCPNGIAPPHLETKQALGRDQLVDMAAELRELQPDLVAVNDAIVVSGRAGTAVARLWATDRARLVVASAGRGFLAFCEELNDIVTRPDDLFVLCCEAALAGGSITPVLTDAMLVDSADAVLDRSEGINDTVRLVLRASAEELAAELDEVLGPLVELRVGNLPYPPVESDENQSVCGLVPAGTAATDAGLAVVSSDVAEPGRPGDDALLTVTVRNDRDQPLSFQNPHVAAVAGPGRRTQLAVSVPAGDPLAPSSDVLEPGEQRTITAALGTASCVPSLGYQLPPGTYDAVLTLQTDGGSVELRAPFSLAD